MRDKVRLIYTDANSNKYYEMEESVTGSIMVSYGRIGTKPQINYYTMNMWDKKYNEKINKGYKDVSTSIVKFSLEDVFANLDKLELKLSEKG